MTISDVKIGDYITGTPENGELTTNQFALLRVKRIFNSMIEVELIAHKKQNGFVGKPYYIYKTELNFYTKYTPKKIKIKAKKT